MKSRYFCQDCKYTWRTKKDVGRPSSCPRCKSKRIIYDNLNNTKIGWMIGITGCFIFVYGIINPNAFPEQARNLSGLVGIPALIITIAMTYDEYLKNKKILKRFNKKN